MVSQVKIGIIDYDGGNRRSISQALAYLACDVVFCQKPLDLDRVTHLVLPGVGAFNEVMKQLERKELITPLKNWAQAGNPFFGICVGMQVMMSRGEEFQITEGLGIFDGAAVSLLDYAKRDVSVPNTGWSQINFSEDSIFASLEFEDSYFYFNHGFVCDLSHSSEITGRAKTDVEFPAVIEKGNVVGVQAHPEKSHVAGLNMLKLFVDGKA